MKLIENDEIPGDIPELAVFLVEKFKSMFVHNETGKEEILKAIKDCIVDKEQITQMQSNITLLKTENGTLRKENDQLQKTVERLEMYQRRDNMAVTGVSEDRDENDRETRNKMPPPMASAPRTRTAGVRAPVPILFPSASIPEDIAVAPKAAASSSAAPAPAPAVHKNKPVLDRQGMRLGRCHRVGAPATRARARAPIPYPPASLPEDLTVAPEAAACSLAAQAPAVHKDKPVLDRQSMELGRCHRLRALTARAREPIPVPPASLPEDLAGDLTEHFTEVLAEDLTEDLAVAPEAVTRPLATRAAAAQKNKPALDRQNMNLGRCRRLGARFYDKRPLRVNIFNIIVQKFYLKILQYICRLSADMLRLARCQQAAGNSRIIPLLESKT